MIVDRRGPLSPFAVNGLAVAFPASIPEVTAVGGTQFSDTSSRYWGSTNDPTGGSALTYVPEAGWNTTAKDKILAASGGGKSILYTKPLWQAGPGVPNDGARDLPDVALVATGLWYCSQGSCYQDGQGDSFSTPMFAGIITILNQYLTVTLYLENGDTGIPNVPIAVFLGSAALAAGTTHVPLYGGQLQPGNNTILVSYSGDRNFNGATVTFNLTAIVPSANSAVSIQVAPNPCGAQPPDANGNQWFPTFTLKELAGIGTTITGFSFAGIDLSSQTVSAFGSNQLPPHGTLSTDTFWRGFTAPGVYTLTFSGVDASGFQWTQQVPVEFDPLEDYVFVNVGGLTNGASFEQVFAPGMVLSVFGRNLANNNAGQQARSLPLPQTLNGSVATINGIPAPYYYAGLLQLNIQIPYETAPGPAVLAVTAYGQTYTKSFNVSPSAPGIFVGPDGATVPYGSGSRGQIYVMFITGEGYVDPPLATGATPPVNPDPTKYPKPKLPVTLTIGGAQAQLLFVGIPPGLAGVTQINFVVPPDAPLGLQPVVVKVGDAVSKPANFTVTQ